MTLATQQTGRGRARLSALRTYAPRAQTSHIEIVENPIHRHDPELAAAVEEQIHRILRDENLGSVTVRFRVCRDDGDGFPFICKVENPPRVYTDVIVPWRWWSPLLETAEEFADALEDGLRVRRARLSTAVAPS